jgi:hypothetical protein
MRLFRAAALFAFLSFLPIVALAQQLAAPPEPGFLAQLPRAWCGVFRWDADRISQHVTIRFDRAEPRADGKIEATGPGLVKTDRVVAFRVRAIIDPATLAIEIFESLETVVPNYVTDGSHVGALAAGLQSMRLVWTTRGTAQRGTMELNARPAEADLAQPCAPPSS